MASLEQAQERFQLAISGLERAIAAAQQRHDQLQGVAQELDALRARYAAIESEQAVLRKSHDALLKQHQMIAKRLDGTISTLHEVLGA